MAQEPGIMEGNPVDADSIRYHIQNNELSQAMFLSEQYLDSVPGDIEVMIIQARLKAWNSAFNESLNILDDVMDLDPVNKEALYLKADVLYWSNDWEELHSYTSGLLDMDPENPDLIYYRALGAYKLGNPEEANRDLRILEKVDPDNSLAHNLKKEIRTSDSGPEIYSSYFYDHFNVPYERRWHVLGLGLSLPYEKFTLIPHLNTGYLASGSEGFTNSLALQGNLDSYIKLGPKNYMFAGYGYSASDYFPDHRIAFNFWQVLPSNWTVSAGARYFYWNEHFTFLSLGVEKYVGNFWFEWKNYLFYKQYGPSVSSYLSLRYYSGNAKDYFGTTIGYGTSPDEPISSLTDLQRLNTLSFRIAYMKQLNYRYRIRAGAGYLFDEYAENQRRQRFEFTASLYIRIK